MKKILTLLGAISIAGSGASTVISCSDNNPNSKKTDQGGFNPKDPSSWGEKQKTVFADSYLASAKVFWTNEVITDSYLTVPKGTNPYTTNPDTIKAIKAALKTNNPKLSDTSLENITLSPATLQTATVVSVTAMIKADYITNQLSLSVVLDPNDQQKADAINAKITGTSLTVPANTNPDTTNAATITALKTALQKNNPALDTADLTKITFADTTLTAGSPVAVTATVTVDGDTATSNLSVTLELPSQQNNFDYRTVADTNVEWNNWSGSSQQTAVEKAGEAVAGDDFTKSPDFEVYDSNQNLIRSDSKTPLSNYLIKGIYLYLQAPEKKFTMIYIKENIT